MKRLVKLAATLSAAILSSCSVTHSAMSGYAIDYSKYADQGFYISPFDQIEGETAIPIASVGITFHGDNKTYADLLPEIVDRAVALGANGLFGLKMNASKFEHMTTMAIDGVAVKIIGKSASNIKPQEFNDGSCAWQKEKVIYDFEKAQSSGRAFVRIKDGEKFYYDPDTDTYIRRDKFLEKYAQLELEKLEKIDK